MPSDRLSLVTNQEMYYLLDLWRTACGPFSFLPTRWFQQGIPPLDSCLEFYPQLDRVKQLLLSKQGLPGARSSDKRANAITKWKDRESKNHMLDRWLSHGMIDGKTSLHQGFVRRVRWHVQQMLGPLNKGVLKEILETCYFGPGVNQGSRFHGAADKVGTRTVTKELLPLARQLLNETGMSRFLIESDGPCSIIDTFFCVCDARLTTVPKQSDKDRVITVEPALNSFLQNGIGEYLRRRLKKQRFHDLSDQAHNQKLAVYPNATIDLSSASDSVTVELCRLLLPAPWFHLMSITRSSRILLGGDLLHLNMMCGMGNGFCFPLETIIFSAIIRAATDEPPMAVYGDDIIVKAYHAETVIETLQLFGFDINVDKSHWLPHDPYRESCGVHRHYSIRVPVVYFKSQEEDPALGIISLHNSLIDVIEPYDANCNQFLKLLRTLVPTVGWDMRDRGGIYFHHRSRANPSNYRYIKVGRSPRPYRGKFAFSAAIYDKVIRGSSLHSASHERFTNRDCRVVRTVRLRKSNQT